MRVISRLFDYTMAVGSIWSFIPRIPTGPERHSGLVGTAEEFGQSGRFRYLM
jgi:hypothetical protein